MRKLLVLGVVGVSAVVVLSGCDMIKDHAYLRADFKIDVEAYAESRGLTPKQQECVSKDLLWAFSPQQMGEFVVERSLYSGGKDSSLEKYKRAEAKCTQ